MSSQTEEVKPTNSNLIVKLMGAREERPSLIHQIEELILGLKDHTITEEAALECFNKIIK